MKWKQSGQPGRQFGAEAGAGAGLSAAEGDLVYNAKLQHGEIFPIAKGRRSRPMSLTRYGSHTVREGCAVIEDEFGKEVYFNTLTVPGSTSEALEAVAKESAGIINAYMQRIRHEVAAWQRDDIDCSEGLFATGVWEWQKRGALHFHLVIGVRDRKLAAHLKHNHRRWWRQVLESYSDKMGIDLFARVDGGTWRDDENKPVTEWAKVKKSVERYVSKYIGKTAYQAAKHGWMPPTRWWYLSAPAREVVLARRIMCSVEINSVQHAASVCEELAEMAQEMGATVLPTNNPFTGALCGYVIYPPKELMEEYWNWCLRVFAEAHDEPAKTVDSFRSELRSEWGYIEDFTNEELIFEGKPLWAVASSGAA